MSLKRTLYQTSFTPIPSHIPRQLAVDLLHNHSEIISLNPLVLEHHQVQAPAKAPADEYYSTWYEIHQRIQFIPGTGKVGSGKITFNTVFHDQPNGLQTHVYAAGGVDIRHNYTIGGNQPGETPVPRPLGSDAPSSGLYLQEDMEIRCTIIMGNFVKKELRAATDVLIARLVKKAELVDAGILHAMMEDGKLKTTNPAHRVSTFPPVSPGLGSPGLAPQGLSAPNRNNYLQPQSSPGLPNDAGVGGVRNSYLSELQGDIRPSQYNASIAQQGLGLELPGDNTFQVQSPVNSTFSGRSQSQYGSSTDRRSYHEVPGDSVSHSSQSRKSTMQTQFSNGPTNYYEISASSGPVPTELPAELPAEPAAAISPKIEQQQEQQASPEWKSKDRLSMRYYNSPATAERNEVAPNDGSLEQTERELGLDGDGGRGRSGENGNLAGGTKRYVGSERIAQMARRRSWSPSDDQK